MLNSKKSISFNSIVVRLKETYSGTNSDTNNKFQFHSGTIKSKNGSLASGGLICFNSIVVRLKDMMLTRTKKLRRSFNSIVVRLKVKGRPEEGKILSVFQFHSGTIKRYRRVNLGFSIKLFQFHSGTIKSRLYFCDNSLRRHVSIP